MGAISALGARVVGDVAPQPSGGEIAVTVIVAVAVGAVVAALVVWQLKKKKK